LSLTKYVTTKKVFALAVGGGGNGSSGMSGGGGGGGFVQCRIYPVADDILSITIGAGATGTYRLSGKNGGQTIIRGTGSLNIIADGGGGSAPSSSSFYYYKASIILPAQTAGSTGGFYYDGTKYYGTTTTNNGASTLPSVNTISINDGNNPFSPVQGNIGFPDSIPTSSGNKVYGGGGAGSKPTYSGTGSSIINNGGDGKMYSLNSYMASPYNNFYFAGGGGTSYSGKGGTGGGGAGTSNELGNPYNGLANTGGGGGDGGYSSSIGGSGIVIIMVQVQSTPDITSITQNSINRVAGTVNVTVAFDTTYPTSPTQYVVIYTNKSNSITNTTSVNTPLAVSGNITLNGLLSTGKQYDISIKATGDPNGDVIGETFTYTTGT
jgi:hypothetical protein